MDCMNCESSDTVLVQAEHDGFADVRHCNACGFDQALPK